MRMGIDTVIIPWKNKKDLVDIPEEYRKKLNFIPVKTLDEVLALALVGWQERLREIEAKKGGAVTQEVPS